MRDQNLYKITISINATQTKSNFFSLIFKIQGKIYTSAIDPYIGRLVSIFSDPNINNNYKSDLAKLEKVDPTLYKIH